MEYVNFMSPNINKETISANKLYITQDKYGETTDQKKASVTWEGMQIVKRQDIPVRHSRGWQFFKQITKWPYRKLDIRLQWINRNNFMKTNIEPCCYF